MDLGYNDYELYGRWTREGVYFVTRLKDNADYIVLEQHPVLAHQHILSDEAVIFAAAKAQTNCPFPLRRIVVQDPDTAESIALLTKHFEFAASAEGKISFTS